jgi:hypothetical protein
MSELTQEKVDALVAPILKMATQEDGFRRAIDHGLNEKPRVTQ